MKKQPWEIVKEIKERFQEFITEADDYVVKENKSAGRRARKLSLELPKMLKDFRSASVDFDRKK